MIMIMILIMMMIMRMIMMMNDNNVDDEDDNDNDDDDDDDNDNDNDNDDDDSGADNDNDNDGVNDHTCSAGSLATGKPSAASATQARTPKGAMMASGSCPSSCRRVPRKASCRTRCSLTRTSSGWSSCRCQA